MIKKLTLLILFFIFIIVSADYFLRDSLKPTNTLSEIDCKDCNVILIVVDTLRQDRLTTYGSSRVLTPYLDKLASRSFVFFDNYSASNWTLPAMMSMFTGMYPQHHLVTNKYSYNSPDTYINLDKTSPHLITLAQYFKESGYHTAGFTGGAGVSSVFGFDKGFDTYSDEGDFDSFESTIPLAMDWLKNISADEDNRHFLFLHGYDVHGQVANNDDLEPYFSKSYKGDLQGSVEEHVEMRDQYQIKKQLFLTDDDKQFLIDRYDDKVLAMDKKIGFFLEDYYSQLGFDNPTLVILTSDHGEELFDHNGIDHGLTLYQEVVKSPLLIHLPEQTKSIKVESRTSAVDLLPTVLDLVGITQNSNAALDGVSFKPTFLGDESQEEVLFHSDYRYLSSLRGGINKDNFKMISDLVEQKNELYDLSQDNQEKNNLASNNDVKNELVTNWLKNFFWQLKL